MSDVRSIAWFRRHGAGFALADELQLDDGAGSLWVHDIDADGRGDVVVRSAGLVVLRSDAEQGLVPDVRLEVPCHEDAAAADLDGDQRPELLMACGEYGLWAFTRAPTGAWSSRPIDFGHQSKALSVLDVDEDGLLDVVVGSYGGLAVLYADP